jgi:protein deglycase
MKKVVVCLANGFEEIEAVSIIDILRRADIQVITASVSGILEVTGAHRIPVKADELIENVDFSGLDMIVLPGGMPGSQNLKNHMGLREKISEFNSKGKLLGAICAAPMVFGDMGILENRNATCYPGFGTYLKQAKLKNDPVVEDGHIITGNGPGAAFQFGFKLVERLKGKESAQLTAKQMLAG